VKKIHKKVYIPSNANSTLLARLVFAFGNTKLTEDRLLAIAPRFEHETSGVASVFAAPYFSVM